MSIYVKQDDTAKEGVWIIVKIELSTESKTSSSQSESIKIIKIIILEDIVSIIQIYALIRVAGDPSFDSDRGQVFFSDSIYVSLVFPSPHQLERTHVKTNFPQILPIFYLFSNKPSQSGRLRLQNLHS